jgi:uncharacterized protein (DUF169 family)
MHHSNINTLLLEQLQLRKPPVAVKIWGEEPPAVPRYQDTAFPGICTQIGEVIESGATFYTVPGQCFCTGGLIATGVLPPLSEEERIESIETHLSISRSYTDVPAALCYDKKMDELIPRVQKKAAAVQVGLLTGVEAPDLVLLFCTPKAADILTRTYAYNAAEPIHGFGGNGACPFLIQYPTVTGKPVFSYSDVAWRKFVKLSDDELTVSFPFELLKTCILNLPMIREAYLHYAEPAE